MSTVIANVSRTSYANRNRPVSIVAGKSYQTNSKAYRTFSADCFTTAPRKSTQRFKYTNDEEWFLAGEIVAGKTPQQIYPEFCAQFGTKHTYHSVELQYRQAVNLWTNGRQGMSHRTNSFMDKLQALDPQTFQD